MGFYVRKSIKAGPFRFNLSKSGIGVSAGVPGFRVGTGPRGNYVNLSTGVLQYRTATRSPRDRQPGPHHPQPAWSASPVLFEDVTGAQVEELLPTGGGDIVEQLNTAARRRAFAWPVTIAVLVIGLLVLPWGAILWALAAPFLWWLFQYEKSRNAVVVFYDVNDEPAEWYELMCQALGGLQNAGGLWRVVQSGEVVTTRQHKTNAGASNLVKRIPARAHRNGPKTLATNVVVPTIEADKTSLHFLPDRILVREGRVYTDISYDVLSAYATARRFIERRGSVPRDGERVGQTWQYVNVKGGPDRRYSNNPVLPIMLYEEVTLTTPHGFRWELQSSLRAESKHLADLLVYRRQHPALSTKPNSTGLEDKG